MRSELELALVAIMFMYPSTRTEYELFANAQAQSVYKLTQSLGNRTMSIAEAKGMTDIVSEMSWRRVAQTASVFPTASIAQQEATQILQTLKRMDKKTEMLSALEQSYKLIEEDNIHDAMRLISEMQVFEKKSITSTKDHMIASLFDGEAFKTGVEPIDAAGGFYTGNLLTLGGDTGSMKTMLSIWLCLSILKVNKDFTVLYFEKEMPVTDIARRLVSNLVNVTAKDIKNAMDKKKKGSGAEIDYLANEVNVRLDADAESIFERFKIVPTTDFESAEDVEEYVYTHKPNVWVLDFVTSLAESKEGKSDMYMFMKNQMDILKRIIHTTHSFGILLAQMKQNALAEKVIKIPEIADLEWSSKINQYSAYIYMCFFPKNYYTQSYVNYKYFYLYGRKRREEMPPTVPLIASPEYAKFANPSKEDSAIYSWINQYIGGKGANK